MDHLTEDALTLLRAAREIHAERHGSQTFTLGTHLPLEEAGRRTGINPERLRYHDAIEELGHEGAIGALHSRAADLAVARATEAPRARRYHPPNTDAYAQGLAP
jgi:hypothetical protein